MVGSHTLTDTDKKESPSVTHEEAPAHRPVKGHLARRLAVGRHHYQRPDRLTEALFSVCSGLAEAAGRLFADFLQDFVENLK